MFVLRLVLLLLWLIPDICGGVYLLLALIRFAVGSR